MNKISKQLLMIAREINALTNEDERLEKAAAKGKKYILHHKEGKLWRIQYCKDIQDAKKGDFGGLVQSQKNLSHKGRCCIYDDAKVYENAKVYGDAEIIGVSEIHGNAKVDYRVVSQEITE